MRTFSQVPQLPDEFKREMDFTDSSFFRTNQSLPTLAQVKYLSNGLYTHPQPNPVIFDGLNLLVKLGPHVQVSEAQCLWMIKRVFHDQVPVPDVFGWPVDEYGYVFIFMELVRGQTLGDRWDGLDHLDKVALCDQLCDIVKALRLLEQDPSKRAYADLHRENIIISSTKPVRVLAIVDWEQAGWYPDYWEYCKALYTCSYESEWRRDLVDGFLEPRVDEFFSFIEYTMAIGAV